MAGEKLWVSLLLTFGLIFGAMVYDPPALLAQGNLFSQLVEASKAEMAKKDGKLLVAVEWEVGGKDIVNAFKKDFPFVKDASFERVRTTDQMQRILTEYKAGRIPKYDILHPSFEAWPSYQEAGAFVKPPIPYKELVKSLPRDWPPPDPRAMDADGYFLATTGLARGIAYNKNLIAPDKAPKGWEDCLSPTWRGKFLYDPRPKLTALQHDPKTREAHLRWLKGIIENRVVLGRGQSENVEKMAAGEYQLFCGVNYTSAMSAIDRGAPLAFFFPDPFPLEFGTQIHVLKWSSTPATTQLFATWLATKAQPLVEKYAYRGFPWDPNSRKYPMAKGKYVAICDVECLKKSPEYDAEHARILGLPGAKKKK
jgi:iron(III) transport system substrate-binding protein